MMKRLLLLGGGHSHVEVLRRFGLHPPERTQIILASPERYTAYSGMLPGLVAGHYAFEDAHIDLEALCRTARADLLRTRAVGLDPDAHTVHCDDGTSIAYDILSVDIGSVPDTAAIAGALEHATPVRPVRSFLDSWDRLRRGAARGFALIGGGAGGVELVLAMHHRLRRDGHNPEPAVHLVTDAPTLLPGFPPRAQRLIHDACLRRGIAVHLRSAVDEVSPGLIRVTCGAHIKADQVFLATGAAAPGWIRSSGLKTDARGFIAVNDALQSLSRPDVFAAGDIASMIHHPRPKSGVHAVRQGPPLARNLRRALGGGNLIAHVPQERALALLSTGDRHAVACYGRFVAAGAWVWRWKDWIDRRFVARYRASRT